MTFVWWFLSLTVLLPLAIVFLPWEWLHELHMSWAVLKIYWRRKQEDSGVCQEEGWR